MVLYGLPSSGSAARTVHITLPSKFASITAGAIEPSGQFAYFAVTPQSFKYSMPDLKASIMRIRLEDFVLAGSLKLEKGENAVTSIAMDPGGQRAYLGTFGDPNLELPASIIRISLRPFAREKAVSLQPGSYGLKSGIIGRHGDRSYWGTYGGEIAGFSMPGMSPLGSVMLQRDSQEIRAGAVDSDDQFIYFGTGTGTLLKIDLSQWLPVATLSLFRHQGGISAGIIDAKGLTSYWLTDGSPTRLAKVEMQSFRSLGEIVLDSDDNKGTAVFLDEPRNSIILVTKGIPAKVVKVDLNSFSKVEETTLSEAFGEVTSAVFDRNRNKVYLGMGKSPARIVQVNMTALSQL